MSDADLAEILKLPPEERLRLAEAIWASLAAEPSTVPLGDAHHQVLDERLAEHMKDPNDVIEQQPTVAAPDYRPWKLAFFGLFLLTDAVFVGIHQALGVLPLSSIYSQTQRVFLYTVVYSGQFLAAFAVGMVLSLVYGLFAGQRGSAYRRVTWMRALAIALLPAAFVVYIAWWGVRHS